MKRPVDQRGSQRRVALPGDVAARREGDGCDGIRRLIETDANDDLFRVKSDFRISVHAPIAPVRLMAADAITFRVLIKVIISGAWYESGVFFEAAQDCAHLGLHWSNEEPEVIHETLSKFDHVGHRG